MGVQGWQESRLVARDEFGKKRSNPHRDGSGKAYKRHLPEKEVCVGIKGAAVRPSGEIVTTT
jgi:hypothetical protein